MKKILEIYVSPPDNPEDEMHLTLYDKDKYNFTPDSEIKVGEMEVKVKMPELTDGEFQRKAIETLKDKQKKIQAKASRSIADLDKKIESLLLIPYNPN